jgi:hypothetical protein
MIDTQLERLAEAQLGKYGRMCMCAWLRHHPEGAIRDAIESMHQARRSGLYIRDAASWVSKRLEARLRAMNAVRAMRDTAERAEHEGHHEVGAGLSAGSEGGPQQQEDRRAAG